MKKRILMWMMAVLAAVIALPVCAGAEEPLSGSFGPNITWRVEPTGDGEGTLVLSGSGEMPPYGIMAGWMEAPYHLNKVVVGEGITQVDERLIGMYATREIQLPSTVTQIEKDTFQFASDLETVTVAAGNPQYGSLYGMLLTEGGTRAEYCPPKNTLPETVEFPAGVEVIGAGLLLGHHEVRQVILHEGVTAIEANAFSQCSLEEFTGPAGLRTIGYRAFYGCGSLTRLNLPEGLESIGEEAFGECAVEPFVLPDNLQEVGEDAFMNCPCAQGNFAVWDYEPETRTLIISGINSRILGLSSWPPPYKDNPQWAALDPVRVVYRPGIRWVDGKVLESFPHVTSISLPVTLSGLSWDEFGNLPALKELTIDPENPNVRAVDGVVLEEQGTRMVMCLPTLETVQVPEGVTVLGAYCFQNAAANLREVRLPEGITTVEGYAFGGCTKLTSIRLPDGVQSIGASAFHGCSALESVRFPDSLQKIEEDGFAACTALRQADLPADAVLEQRVFVGCTKLETVTLPAHLKQVPPRLFTDCVALHDVVIPEGVTELGESCFAQCRSLHSITLPRSLRSIGPGAFADNGTSRVPTWLKEIYYAGSLAEWGQINISSYHNSAIDYATLHVGQQEGFTDVPAGAYYHDAVEWAVRSKVTKGTSASTFSPNKTCTRAEAVTFLWRAAGEYDADIAVGFRDVPGSAWYAKAVAWAVEMGITNGTTSTTFSPNQVCSRGQIVTFLWRASQQPLGYPSPLRFTDVKADKYYADAVEWAAAFEIANGTGRDKFSPETTCTRAQIVTFLQRAMTGTAQPAFDERTVDQSKLRENVLTRATLKAARLTAGQFHAYMSKGMELDGMKLEPRVFEVRQDGTAYAAEIDLTIHAQNPTDLFWLASGSAERPGREFTWEEVRDYVEQKAWTPWRLGEEENTLIRRTYLSEVALAPGRVLQSAGLVQTGLGPTPIFQGVPEEEIRKVDFRLPRAFVLL